MTLAVERKSQRVLKKMSYIGNEDEHPPISDDKHQTISKKQYQRSGRPRGRPRKIQSLDEVVDDTFHDSLLAENFTDYINSSCIDSPCVNPHTLSTHEVCLPPPHVELHLLSFYELYVARDSLDLPDVLST